MEKAYDVKDLGTRLKAKGLIEAEDLAKDVYEVVKEWIKESAPMSENKFDDMLAPFLDQLDAFVLPQIDKIDGAQG